MTSAATESTPLIPANSSTARPVQLSPKPQRSVTFNPTVTSSSPTVSPSARAPSQVLPSSTFNASAAGAQHGSQPLLSALNTKLRRRHSQGSPLVPSSLQAPKIGPQRTTRTAQKLKLLPSPEHGEDGPDEESGRDVYAQFTRIKDPTARRDAARLGKEDRERLPRVTAYCTASSYQMEDIMRYLKGKSKTRSAAPKLFDECIYTPYNYGRSSAENAPGAKYQSSPPRQERRYSDSAVEVEHSNGQRREDLIDLHTSGGDISLDNGESSLQVSNHRTAEVVPPGSRPDNLDFDTEVHTPEVFLFNYGTVVIWGMTLQQEQRFLKEIAKFEVEKLAPGDIQTEDFNFYYTREYQARIYNDFISLRDKKAYMTKLAISHALSQSVKVGSFRASNTIHRSPRNPSVHGAPF